MTFCMPCVSRAVLGDRDPFSCHSSRLRTAELPAWPLGCAASPHSLLNATVCFGCCLISDQTCLAMFISKPLELYCQGLLCFWYLQGSISPVSLCLRGLTAKLIPLLFYPTPQSLCRGGTDGNHRQDTHPEGKLAGLQAGEKHSRASILTRHLPLLECY